MVVPARSVAAPSCARVLPVTLERPAQPRCAPAHRARMVELVHSAAALSRVNVHWVTQERLVGSRHALARLALMAVPVR